MSAPLRLDSQTDDAVKEMTGDLTFHVETHGGPGKKKKADKKSIVPIAMGIDATDRDLYNAVSSLYRSVQALESKVTAVPAAGADPTAAGRDGNLGAAGGR